MVRSTPSRCSKSTGVRFERRNSRNYCIDTVILHRRIILFFTPVVFSMLSNSRQLTVPCLVTTLAVAPIHRNYSSDVRNIVSTNVFQIPQLLFAASKETTKETRPLSFQCIVNLLLCRLFDKFLILDETSLL